jgi:hypothetical protein
MNIDSDQPRWIAICAFATLLVCSLLALYRPLIEYDSWWYHLPFSSRIWGIGGGAETFHRSGVVSARWAGFPKAWEWLQGLAWWATGTLRAIVIPQLLLCAAYFSHVTSTHRVPLSWMILAFFASPMFFIHFQATYLDLPAAICVAALRETGRYCTADDDELPFRFSCAVTGVAGLISNVATDCEGHSQSSRPP